MLDIFDMKCNGKVIRDYAAEAEIAKPLASLTKAFYMQVRPGGIKYL